MKRHKHLYANLTSFENLLRAARQAQRGKRFLPATLAFNHRLETELLLLQHELQTGTYRPGPFKTFTIHDPKPLRRALDGRGRGDLRYNTCSLTVGSGER